MAELAEQKVHFGRGPRTVDVIWVAMGSVVLVSADASISRGTEYYRLVNMDL